MFQSDFSDLEIEVTTFARLPPKSVELRTNCGQVHVSASERLFKNIIFKQVDTLEGYEEINNLLRLCTLKKLMEEKKEKPRTRAHPRWSEHRRVALRQIIARAAEVRGALPKNIKYRQVVRSYQSQTQTTTKKETVQESVKIQQIEHQWIDFRQEYLGEIQREVPQWVGFIELPPPTEPVHLTPVETARAAAEPRPQVTEVKEVTQIHVQVENIRIYKQFLDR